MATSEGVKEHYDDLLNCTICLETFKISKYLPCLHTFCQICIQTYIVSAAKDESSKGFKCPVCRRQVSSDDCRGSRETWAEQLPINHLAISMIDRKAVRSAEKCCDACEIQNRREQANFWCTVCEEAYCETCVSSHKTFKSTKNHKLISLKELNEGKEINANVICDQHPEKTVEVYCRDHSKPCCTLCATVHHRKCDQVVTIDQAVSGIKQSQKAQGLSKKLAETSKRLEELIQCRKQNIAAFKNESESVLSEIDKVKETIIKQLEKLEQSLKDDLKTIEKQVSVKLDDEVAEISNMKRIVKNWKTIFEACLSQGSEVQCLVKLEEILEKVPQLDADISKIVKEIRDMSVQFQPMEEITSIKSLGRVKLKGSLKPALRGFRGINFHSGKVKLIKTIDIGTREISGIFSDYDIIFSDRANSRILTINESFVNKEKLKIPYKPTDITKVTDQTVAVATQTTYICLININPLTFNKTITVSVNVHGLSYTDDTYVTVNYSSQTITWIDATTMSTIKSISTGIDTRFVSCYENKDECMYLSGQYSIKRVSNSGRDFTYKNTQLNYPYGYDFDCDENIYVVDFNSKNIHQLSPDGKLIRIIPISDFSTITDKPWVIRCQQDSNRFLLTFYYIGKVLICEIE